MKSLWDAVLPDRYQAGELPGESLPGEAVRRATWKVLPEAFLRRAWRRILLREDGLWCFVLGVNNSGTTLLHDLLGRHSEVRTLPGEGLVNAEGQWHTNALPVEEDFGVPRLFSARRDVFRLTEDDDPEAAARALHDWGFRYVRQPGRVLLEKSPPNAIRSRWLQRHFEPARFVALVRHPLAVAEGVRRRAGHDIGEAARHWATANEILLDDLEHLDASTLVRYEALCEDPLATLRGLAEFLDIPPSFGPDDLSGVSAHSLDEAVDTIENFNPRSFERLSEDDVRAVASEAGEVAERLGYEIPPRGVGGRAR